MGRKPTPRVNVRRVPAATPENPDGGHATLSGVIGVDAAVAIKLVIYDDAVDLVVPGAAPILLDELHSLKLEKLLRQARKNMPPPEELDR